TVRNTIPVSSSSINFADHALEDLSRMRDHTGRYRTRYEDTLRALGHYLDQHRFTRIAVIETPEGFLVKGYVAAPGRDEESLSLAPETLLFTDADLIQLLEEAYRRRGTGGSNQPLLEQGPKSA
ncbi:MAG: hypothetical protein QXT77_08100, partial [Candidatus Methanomethylicaceae archaeon]